MAHFMRLTLCKPKDIIIRSYNKIVMTDDGSTIVALHRDQGFPYEHSKPLPEEVAANTSVLKMTDIGEVKRIFKDMTPEMARKQLSSLTLTTEHRWFPKARTKRARKFDINRPYL